MLSNPFAVLGLSPDAGDVEVREAYRRLLRQHPPDRDPEGFKRLRAAFEALADERRRRSLRLFGLPPVDHLEDVLPDGEEPLRHVGPEPWLAVLREKDGEG
jgi:curved DNA-binding protein CbpA